MQVQSRYVAAEVAYEMLLISKLCVCSVLRRAGQFRPYADALCSVPIFIGIAIWPPCERTQEPQPVTCATADQGFADAIKYTLWGRVVFRLSPIWSVHRLRDPSGTRLHAGGNTSPVMRPSCNAVLGGTCTNAQTGLELNRPTY